MALKKARKNRSVADILKEIMKRLKKERYMGPRERSIFMLKHFGDVDYKTLFMFVPEYSSYKSFKDLCGYLKIEINRTEVLSGYSK